ncbi:MAG: oligosaccharide flippase family protein, partial [Bacteroidota bacterium]
MSITRNSVISNISWSTIASASLQVFVFVVGILLARLLEPKDFGVIGMILVITSFATIVQNMGFNASIIQKSEINQSHLNAVFWFNIILGSALLLLL